MWVRCRVRGVNEAGTLCLWLLLCVCMKLASWFGFSAFDRVLNGIGIVLRWVNGWVRFMCRTGHVNVRWECLGMLFAWNASRMVNRDSSDPALINFVSWYRIVSKRSVIVVVYLVTVSSKSTTSRFCSRIWVFLLFWLFSIFCCLFLVLGDDFGMHRVKVGLFWRVNGVQQLFGVIS